MRLPIYSENHANADLCGACGGACCKNYPGIAHPADFGAPDRAVMLAALTDVFRSNKWAIDWWEGDPRPDDERGTPLASRAYFVRPHVAGDEGFLRVPTWGGPCTFHSHTTGCALEHDARPLQCRVLVPHPDGHGKCYVNSTIRADKRAIVLAWLPYADIIEAAEAAAEADKAAE